MKLFFVADARSPTAQGWIKPLIELGFEVHLASTYPADPISGLASHRVIPVAFSSAAEAPGSLRGSLLRRLFSPALRTAVRQQLGLLTLPRAANRLRMEIAAVRPDLVHALRIPFEGFLAARALGSADLLAMRNTSLVVSVWGNDFTLHARASRPLASATRRTLQATSALLADTHRDLRLAADFGFPAGRPRRVLPGGGGVPTGIFYPPKPQPHSQENGLTIIQPRGPRTYVHTEAFLQAVPHVLKVHPNTRFVCPALADHAPAVQTIERLGLQNAVLLLPRLPAAELANRYRSAEIFLSPTSHDGTPNSLLEAMACGCFPVAGDLESVREWIETGRNGILVDAEDPASIAHGLIQAIEAPALRAEARTANLERIRAQAARPVVTAEAERFYREVG